ncbi:MAG: hypothetical protein LUQ71_05010 [Methanoregula sp.]|nr:hypothetical protein [Methanoregula sp.]
MNGSYHKDNILLVVCRVFVNCSQVRSILFTFTELNAWQELPSSTEEIGTKHRTHDPAPECPGYISHFLQQQYYGK